MEELLIIGLVVLPFLAVLATHRLWVWYKFYGTRFLWGLFLASITSDIASFPIALLSLRRLIVGPDAPRLEYATVVAAGSLLVLESIFIYIVIRWWDLDNDMKRERKGIQDMTYSTNLPPEEARDIDRREDLED